MQLTLPGFNVYSTVNEKPSVIEFTFKAENGEDEIVLTELINRDTECKLYIQSYVSKSPDGKITAVTFRGMK